VIGFNQTPQAEQAVSQAAALFAPRPALVVVVWEAALAFQAATVPALEAWNVAVDISQAVTTDQLVHDAARQWAHRGAALAKASGMPARGVAAADDASVADTLIRIAQERDAVAIAVGAHARHGPGRTAKDLLDRAPFPVIVMPQA
jgi:nucleotide-binding universal stress UspA family protein